MPNQMSVTFDYSSTFAVAEPGIIASVIDFGLKMQMLEQMVNVVPILHHEHVALIHDENLDGGEKIVVGFRVSFTANRRSEP